MARIRGLGRKGWLSAFRDATPFKVAYAYPPVRYPSRTATTMLMSATKNPAMVHSVCRRVHLRLDRATFSLSGDSGLAPALPRPAWLTWIWLLESR